MADLVLDASAACSLCFEDEADPAGDKLLDALQGGEIWVPALFSWEVANVLLMAEKRQRLNQADRVEFLQLLESLALQLDPASTAVVWHDVIHLAQQCNLKAYDAAYLELAMRRGLPLASMDRQIVQAARTLGVPLLLG